MPLVAIAFGQVLISFNVASLPVAMSGMVESFQVGPTVIATGVVAYSMIVAAFVMLGAKLVQRFGAVQAFRLAVTVFGVGQVLMSISQNATSMILAQVLCGTAGAVIVPSLVALIAENYHGSQQATALGALGSARAGAGVLAFLIGGVLGTYIGWRPLFGILVVVSALVLVLSFWLKRDSGRPTVTIDFVGVLFAAIAMIFISFGFNNLSGWGMLSARSSAPFAAIGISPALVMIAVGVLFGWLFLRWTRRRERNQKMPLLPLMVLNSPSERAAVYAMFSVGALEAALNFSVPLYIQIVQGRTPLATAFAMLPFKLTMFFAAMLIVRFYGRFTQRQIGGLGFGLCSAALVWLAFVVRNDWSTLPVILGLVLFGIAQGALVTLLFNVLVTASPKELAGDVGSLRGATNNLAIAVGTAVVGALCVGILSAAVMSRLAESPNLPIELLSYVNLDSVTFVSNDHLREIIARTNATPEQKEIALHINIESRLLALKIGFLTMAVLAALAILPARRLPDYRPGEIPEP